MSKLPSVSKNLNNICIMVFLIIFIPFYTVFILYIYIVYDVYAHIYTLRTFWWNLPGIQSTTLLGEGLLLCFYGRGCLHLRWRGRMPLTACGLVSRMPPGTSRKGSHIAWQVHGIANPYI